MNVLFYMMIISQIIALPLSKDEIPNKNKPYENSKLYQGDILLPPSSKLMGRGLLLRGDTVAWPKGIVPYEILPGYGSSQQAFIISTMQKMERAIAINNVACVQFRPRISSDQYYISFFNGEGCSTYVGQNRGEVMNRTVTLEYPGCFVEGIIMHELLHTLGFLHEQSRPDRDDYIKVLYENIQPGMESNFEKYNNTQADTQGTPYDYGSVMHYGQDAFSTNGLPTIETLTPNVQIGQRINMSVIDIEEVRLFYNCSSTGITFPPVPTTTTVNFYTMNTSVSSSWTTNSDTFNRYGGLNESYYYEAYQLNVPSNGYYVIRSDSLIDTFGYLYLNSFYPSLTYFNLIQSDDDSGGGRQFLFTIYLQSNQTYVIICTTYTSLVTGTYNLIVSGLVNVNLTKITILKNVTIPTTTVSTSTSFNGMISTYLSRLGTNSSIYTRYGGNGTYYYESIILSVPTTGSYTLQSNSSVDTYGYLYLNSFDPLNPSNNLIAEDDDDAGNGQFAIRYQLASPNRYILIATTYAKNEIGSFSIIAMGPSTVVFNPLDTTSTMSTITSSKTSVSTGINSTVSVSTTTKQSTTTTSLASTSTKSNIIVFYLLIFNTIGYFINN